MSSRRKSPGLHIVSAHARNGKPVRAHPRGKGKKVERKSRVVRSSTPIGKQLYEMQDLWLEHYAFGRPHDDPDRYSDRPNNKERARIQEHAMDAVREMRKTDWIGWGYVEEKLGRIHDNYLSRYRRDPYLWGDFKRMTKNDKEIFSKFVELERSKTRPLYAKLENPIQRAAIRSVMDFAVLVSNPDVTKAELWVSYNDLRKKVDDYYKDYKKA